MIPINVKSEISPLKRVLLHRPGEEFLFLTPNTLSELLFDDIPDLELAQEEHDQFAKIFTDNGIDVVYLEDLVAETLNDSTIKERFIEQFLSESGQSNSDILDECKQYLLSIEDNKDLVLKTMAGISLKEIGHFDKSKLNEMEGDKSYLAINPMPNLYFTRDSFATIGTNVSINKMYSETRNRETIYGEYIFKYHPSYKNVVNLYGRDEDYHIEGGDILNLSKEKLLIGISQRTEFEAIKKLAYNIFFNNQDNYINTVYAMEIPNVRAFMHLDTVFTMIDYNAFTYHPGIMKTLKIFEITKGENDLVIEELHKDLDVFLAEALGIDKVRLFACGDGDPIAAEREQWSDGSNTLAIAPGELIVYKRNKVTNKALKQAGFILHELDVSNLSVGRGGPRCMSMPLIRE